MIPPWAYEDDDRSLFVYDETYQDVAVVVATI